MQDHRPPSPSRSMSLLHSDLNPNCTTWGELAIQRLSAFSSTRCRAQDVLATCLKSLRIYPASEPGLTGTHTGRHIRNCLYCTRPRRLFDHDSTDHLERLLCSICRWQQYNKDLLRVQGFRLWPRDITPELWPIVLQFLCSEGADLTCTVLGNIMSFEVPELTLIASMANSRAWQTTLLTGIRLAQPLSVPLSDSVSSRHDNWTSVSHLHARWTMMTLLGRNPFWRLLLSCPIGRRQRGQFVGKGPFFVIVSFLGTFRNA